MKEHSTSLTLISSWSLSWILIVFFSYLLYCTSRKERTFIGIVCYVVQIALAVHVLHFILMGSIHRIWFITGNFVFFGIVLLTLYLPNITRGTDNDDHDDDTEQDQIHSTSLDITSPQYKNIKFYKTKSKKVKSPAPLRTKRKKDAPIKVVLHLLFAISIIAPVLLNFL